jgi:hypothetical protein
MPGFEPLRGAKSFRGVSREVLAVERENHRPTVRSSTGRRRGAEATILATHSWITPIIVRGIEEKEISVKSRLKTK